MTIVSALLMLLLQRLQLLLLLMLLWLLHHQRHNRISATRESLLYLQGGRLNKVTLCVMYTRRRMIIPWIIVGYQVLSFNRHLMLANQWLTVDRMHG